MSRYPRAPVLKPKGRRVTYHQVDALFDYLSANQELAIGYSNSTAGRYKGQRAWETVAGLLNRIAGGARKDAKGWSAFWSNYKNKLKRRVRLVRSARKNGQSPTTRLTELDEKILPILGPLFGCGSLPSVRVESAVVKCEFTPPGSPTRGVKPSPGSPGSPDSSATPESPPTPPRAKKSRKAKAKSKPAIRLASLRANNGDASDASDSDNAAIDMARLYEQTEDKTASALIRVAGAIESLAEAARAQAAATRAAASIVEAVARLVTETISGRSTTVETNKE